MDTVGETELMLLAALWKSSLNTANEMDESSVAVLIDRYRQGRLKPSELGAPEVGALLAVLPVMERMESAGSRFPLPEALEAAVERYYRAEKAGKARRHQTDSLVVRLRESLELVSATLTGLEPAFQPVSATRRSATAQKINMYEDVVGGGVIEYDILRSGENTVMVSVVFRDLQGPLTVRLSENGRPVSSQTIREVTGRIHFDGLSAGEYRLDLTGCCDRSFTLQLLGTGE